LIDADLLARVARRDAAAFAELFEATRERLWAFIMHMAGRETVEDLLQETYIKVWRFAADLKNPGDAKAWIFTIARNVVRSHYRKRSSAPMQRITASRENGYGISAETIPDGGAGPGGPLESHETALRVRNALDELPLEQREVIVLKEFEGMKFREIAGLLDCPIGTVKSRMRYGTLKLAELLQEVR
jgi:RNA polymerase sigma-70 factor (ECF subfamily)